MLRWYRFLGSLAFDNRAGAVYLELPRRVDLIGLPRPHVTPGRDVPV